MGLGQGAGRDHLISLSADEAFQAYEAVRHRLPAIDRVDRDYRRARSIADIADQFDVFLLDAFGVLNIGETAIEGTRERIAAMRAAGKRVFVVSNAASVSQAGLQEKYARLDYDFSLDEIVTSRATLAKAMRSTDAIHWGVMGAADERLRDMAPLQSTVLEDDTEIYHAAQGFLLIGSGSWTEARQVMLEEALRTNPRKVLVANPDIVAPRETGFSAEPGHFAHRLADRTGVVPEFFGKPFPGIFDISLARAGAVDKARVLMVGDSLHTDILGARAVGIASALVTRFGFFANADADRSIHQSGIIPDFVIDRP